MNSPTILAFDVFEQMDCDARRRLVRRAQLLAWFFHRREVRILESVKGGQVSDKDATHLVEEIQAVRGENDRLRAAILAHKQAMAEYHPAVFDSELWAVLSPLPGGE
jgi:diphthamide synthase subunit DPH2